MDLMGRLEAWRSSVFNTKLWKKVWNLIALCILHYTQKEGLKPDDSLRLTLYPEVAGLELLKNKNES